VVLALMVLRLQKATDLTTVNATVFEPASEHGQAGMDELHQQTVNLLSFQQLPKKIFDVQVAFNMISRYGEQISPTLASVQERIIRHYRSITGDALLPSVLLVQAPIFHGYAFAVRLEFSSPADAHAVSKVLSGEHVTITSSTDESPSNVNAAGQGSVLVSVLPDASSTQGVWLWAAADNLRLAAVNAVECAESLSASRPSGQVQ